MSRQSRQRAPITMALCDPATPWFSSFRYPIIDTSLGTSVIDMPRLWTHPSRWHDWELLGFGTRSRTSHGCHRSLCARCDDCNSLAVIGGTKAQGIIATGGLSNLRDTEKEQSSGRQPRLTATPRIMRSLTSPTVCPVLECPSLPPTVYSLQ